MEENKKAREKVEHMKALRAHAKKHMDGENGETPAGGAKE
jgi:hypothetical protein